MNHYKPFFKVFRNSAGSVFVMRMLLCLFFCCQLPLRFAQACNTTKEAFEHYSFLMPELLEPLPPNAPFLTDFETFYKKYVGAAEAQAQSNVGEWVEIFCQSVHPQDVAQVIYGLSLKEMEMLQTAVRSKRMALPPKIRNNS
ncbi:MAG TPA: hypothetical protein ENJ45_01940, partial [Phaeodactylibacter sp.]|nr:hypothetical protein [Phaeodactylibacter sp.]